MNGFLPFVSDDQHKMTANNLKQLDETILSALHQNQNRVLE